MVRRDVTRPMPISHRPSPIPSHDTMRVHESCLGQFELLGASSDSDSTSDSELAFEASKAVSALRVSGADDARPEDWEPPHWIPHPVPADFDIVSPPWIRPPAPRHVFTNVHVVDTEKAKVRKHMTVVVEKGEIVSVEEAKSSDKGVDCGGLYLCPGLIDCERLPSMPEHADGQATRTSPRRRAWARCSARARRSAR